MRLTQPLAPEGKLPAERGGGAFAAAKLDLVALAIVERDRLDRGKAFKRPSQAGGGVLPAGEEHDGLVARHGGGSDDRPTPRLSTGSRRCDSSLGAPNSVSHRANAPVYSSTL